MEGLVVGTSVKFSALTTRGLRAIVSLEMVLYRARLRSLVLVLCLAVPLCGQVASEPASLPSWVLLGLGKRMAEQHLYGEAVVSLRKAVDRKGVFPEAEVQLATIAGLNGNPALQESLLEKALSETGLLQVTDDRYTILYALADLRLKTEQVSGKLKGGQALETWREILQDDAVYQRVQDSGGLEGYYRALMATPSPISLKTSTSPGLSETFFGLNRVLYLYRHPLTFSLKAHQNIASVSLENRAYKVAAAESLFAFTGILSTVIDEVKVFHPEYVFRDLKEFFVDNNSPVYLGKPAGASESTAQPGGPNPGWLVRYQPVWDYLRAAGTRQTLETLAGALDGLAAQEKAGERDKSLRPASEVAAEVRQWQKILINLGVR